jgi:hypothetical protein
MGSEIDNKLFIIFISYIMKYHKNILGIFVMKYLKFTKHVFFSFILFGASLFFRVFILFNRFKQKRLSLRNFLRNTSGLNLKTFIKPVLAKIF